MTHTADARGLPLRGLSPGGLSPPKPPLSPRSLTLWTLSWAAVGCAVALGFVFATGVDFWPTLRLSISFAVVVGVSAFTSARLVFPLFERLPYGLRLALEILTVLSATFFGSVVVIWLQPLFSLAQPRRVALIVLVNAAIAVVVGIALSTYDRMKRQIEASYETLRQKEALERELSIARDVQRQLLPRTVPRAERLELAGACIPAIGVGGDYYDFLSTGDDRLGLVIADVSGKGVPAALLMAGLQASVRSLWRPAADPGLLNSQLSRNLYQSSSDSRYATLFLGFFDPAECTVRYSNAGHHPPVLLRGDSVVRLTEGGVPIGLFEEATYRDGRQQLEIGDLLALFTDGVVEAPNAAEEEFGEARLIEALRRSGGQSLDRVIERVLDELHRWTGGTEAHDDVTLVLARVR